MLIDQTSRKDAFCQHALNNPNEVLVIEDALDDDRFINNPLVTGDPYFRSYAGAPLETPKGNVLGMLCVIDRQPRQITEQQNALQLLANRVMRYFERRNCCLATAMVLNLGRLD